VTASWLPAGRQAAVCLSVDDVMPARSSDDYEAGGDLLGGVLGHLEWLLERHPQLRATLFVCPDWRLRSPRVTRTTLAGVPWLRDRAHLAPPRRDAALRLDRHPEFCRHLREHERYEVAVHGLHHVARGRQPVHEFGTAGRRAAAWRLRWARALFRRAGVPIAPGFAPPGWGLSPAVARAAADAGFEWVVAARDLVTPVAPDATAAMSGLRGVSLLHPQPIAGGRLVHLPVNWQATSDDERAFAIVEAGGLVSIKAHAIKDALGHVAADGLDHAYREQLDALLCRLEDRYGDALWWTTLGAVARRARTSRHAARTVAA
jgi:hypothetical protein